MEPREPNEVVRGVRTINYVIVALAILLGLGILFGMLKEGWWYILPLVAVLVYCTYVLYRNRRRV